MRLGRWETVRELGQGGQGVAHLALDSEELDMDKLLNDVSRAIGEVNAIPAGPEQKYERVRRMLDLFERYMNRLAPENCAVLKVLHSQIVKDEKALRRLETEVRLLTELDHPSLVRLIDARSADGWYVTPFYREGSLDKHLRRFAGRPLAALEAFRSLVDGVAVLHEKGVVHRDIKPENVFVVGLRLVLGDFGIAYID